MSLFGDDPTCGIPTCDSGDDFYTPPEVLDLLPPIAFDPCWSPASLVRAAAHLDVRDGADGLRDEWQPVGDGIVFVNHPFSDTARWLAKCRSEADRLRRCVVALTPAYPADQPWHRIVWPYAKAVAFFPHRLQFLTPSGERETKGRGHAIVLFGPKAECEQTKAHIERAAGAGLLWVTVDFVDDLPW